MFRFFFFGVRSSLWAAGIFCLALLIVYFETAWSMVSIWSRSDTFAHGFLILPISLWLVWSQRGRLRQIDTRPALFPLLLIVPAGLAWLLAWLVDVSVVQQLSLVAILIVGAWAIMGHSLARVLAFPLLFLFFSVPMGEALISPMMEFTASSTVWLVQQTGIPVYREGLYFSLPTGRWSVVEACSGVRYIIASVTLGVLYAYLTYRSVWRRSLFVLVSAIVPVFANSIRAYIIVMLGHMSGMTVATGADHLVYGWVFFGLVIFLLFWLGAFFREDQGAFPGEAQADKAEATAPVTSPTQLLVTATIALLVAAVWPFVAHILASRSVAGSDAVITLPQASNTWQVVSAPSWRWQPRAAVAGRATAYYALDGRSLGLFVQYSDDLLEDTDVIGSSTLFADAENQERVLSQGKVSMRLLGEDILVDQAQVRNEEGEFVARSWYLIGDLHTSNDYFAKLKQAQGSLGLGPTGAYRIVLAMPAQEIAASEQALEDFLEEHGHALNEALRRTAESGR